MITMTDLSEAIPSLTAGHRERADALLTSWMQRGFLSDASLRVAESLVAIANGAPAAAPVDLGPTKEQLAAAIPHLTGRDLEFATSLLNGWNKFGHLTERQEPYVVKMIAKAREVVAPTPKPQAETVGDILAIFERFGTAHAAGLQRPIIRTLARGNTRNVRLAVSEAPSTGRNAGALYVKADAEAEGQMEYVGKIEPNGSWRPASNVSPGASGRLLGALRAFAADPVGQASLYGHETGTCCFCAQALTDGRSVAVGYGPICAGKFGLPWGEQTTAAVEVA